MGRCSSRSSFSGLECLLGLGVREGGGGDPFENKLWRIEGISTKKSAACFSSSLTHIVIFLHSLTLSPAPFSQRHKCAYFRADSPPRAHTVADCGASRRRPHLCSALGSARTMMPSVGRSRWTYQPRILVFFVSLLLVSSAERLRPDRGSADRLSPRGSQKKAAVTDGEPQRDETASCQRLLLIGPLIIWPPEQRAGCLHPSICLLIIGFSPCRCVCVCAFLRTIPPLCVHTCHP